MFRKALIIGLILPIAAYLCKVIVVSISGIQVGEFKPVAAIFLLDISASSRGSLFEQQQCILRMTKKLDSEDHAKIYVISEDAYEVYDGGTHKTSDMRKALNKRSEYDEKAYGTAYGLALKKAIGDALRYKKDGYTPAIIVLGDLENEGAINKQINWNTLPKNIQNTKKYIPELTLAFLYAHPQRLDEVRHSLIKVMDESKLIIASEENVDLATRKFLQAVGR